MKRPQLPICRVAVPIRSRFNFAGMPQPCLFLLGLGVLLAFRDANAGHLSQNSGPPGASAATPESTRPGREKWWSLEPLERPKVPVVSHPGARVVNGVDAFVVEKLASLGLQQSAEADRRILIRRLYFDLVGLPPNPGAIEAFVADPHPRAYENLVDWLLASPHYGERWARHWLDVVHYGETHGYDKDKPRPNAWPYRDYVIRSFNEDKSYARFVQEQVAGDVLFPGTRDGFEALGFIAAGPWDLIGHEEVPESKIDGKIARHLDRDDMVANTMQTFNSLTVQCAQCHNHKFDPISREDYYSMQAVFAAVDRADQSFDADPLIRRKRQQLTEKLNRFAARKKQLESRASHAATVTNAEIGVVIRDIAAVKGELGELPPPAIAYVAAVHHGSGSFAGTGKNGGRPRPIHVLSRGNVLKPGDEIGPGALNCLPGLPARFDLPPEHGEGERRAALALWLTRKDNPLTWRSIVNRIWQHHFGRGLVETPNDFGRMGELPTHRELLDWLAVEFREGGQSLKTLHRLLVTSATYRQSSANQAAFEKVDSDNRFLWRANRRKLEAEAVRDAVLFVAGKMNPKMGGSSFQDFVIEKPEHSPHYEYHLHDPDDASSHRRSVYRFIVRSQQQPFMTTLDCADPSMQVGRRNASVSPLQALAMMNNSLILAMSKHFAAQLEQQPGDLPAKARIAYYEAVGRAPSEAAIQLLVDYAHQFGLPNMCRVLFNLNEFTFVD